MNGKIEKAKMSDYEDAVENGVNSGTMHPVKKTTVRHRPTPLPLWDPEELSLSDEVLGINEVKELLEEDDGSGIDEEEEGAGCPLPSTPVEQSLLETEITEVLKAGVLSDEIDLGVLAHNAAESAEEFVRKVWEASWKVVNFKTLPHWLQDNDYIHTGHRPPLPSFYACFKSIFRIHTETGNIWTHLLAKPDPWIKVHPQFFRQTSSVELINSLMKRSLVVKYKYYVVSESHELMFWRSNELVGGLISLLTRSTSLYESNKAGSVVSIGMATYTLMRPSAELGLQEKLIFGTFFFGVIVCLGLSSAYHTLYCHSECVAKLFSKLDYCGIAVLIMGSFVPWLYYGFYCKLRPKLIYLSVVFILGVSSIVVSLWDRFSLPRYRPLRAGVFMFFGLSGVVPAVHHALSEGWCNAVTQASLGWVILMGFLYILGAVFYTLRVPERFFPGKCDIWFQSHQIFHVLVLAAAFVHYHGISEMASYRITVGDCARQNSTAMVF